MTPATRNQTATIEGLAAAISLIAGRVGYRAKFMQAVKGEESTSEKMRDDFRHNLADLRTDTKALFDFIDSLDFEPEA